MKRPEQQLQISVMQYLRYQCPNALFFHVPNNIPMRGKARLGGIMKAMGVMSGVGDILIFWRGGYAAIELKAGKNTQQPSQKNFQYTWQYMGGKYALCRSIEEVGTYLRLWGVITQCPPANAPGSIIEPYTAKPHGRK